MDGLKEVSKTSKDKEPGMNARKIKNTEITGMRTLLMYYNKNLFTYKQQSNISTKIFSTLKPVLKNFLILSFHYIDGVTI